MQWDKWQKSIIATMQDYPEGNNAAPSEFTILNHLDSHWQSIGVFGFERFSQQGI